MRRIQLPPNLSPNPAPNLDRDSRIPSKVESRTDHKRVAERAIASPLERESTAITVREKPNQTAPFGLRRVLKNTLLGAAFTATALVTAGLGAIAVITFPLPRQLSGEAVAPPLTDLWRSGFRYQVAHPVNILVMGLDEARDIEGATPEDLVGRTDTMLLVRVDPDADIVNVMSIPRDTRVEIPGYGIDKINEANAEGGAELAAQTVSRNFSNVEIDRYIRVSTTAFKEIVDLVGGIEVLVPKAMEYEDKTQGLVIDLEPGLQTLNGDQAEQFARFRQDAYGDIGRVQRQQILLKALRQRLTNPTVLPKLPQIIRVLQKRIDTNLTVEELLALAGFGLDLERQDLQMVMLPGRFSTPEEYRASYWLSDPSVNSEIMRTYFDADTVEFVNDIGTNYYETPSDWALSNLRVAVQNATNERYASSSMAEYLRDQGFYDVYVVTNWPRVERETSVVVQRGDVGSAREIKSILDLGQVVSESTGDIDSDITIRVGEDWLEQIDPDWQRLPYDGPR
ncbi:LCP family protein [cf. Phormidesmis sp. LEGE 11477]|nr:LCP family protein [cf. Phormidesmis sp. LEGE 11477]